MNITESIAREILIAFDDMSQNYGLSSSEVEDFCHEVFQTFPDLRNDPELANFAAFIDDTMSDRLVEDDDAL